MNGNFACNFRWLLVYYPESEKEIGNAGNQLKKINGNCRAFIAGC